AGGRLVVARMVVPGGAVITAAWPGGAPPGGPPTGGGGAVWWLGAARAALGAGPATSGVAKPSITAVPTANLSKRRRITATRIVTSQSETSSRFPSAASVRGRAIGLTAIRATSSPRPKSRLKPGHHRAGRAAGSAIRAQRSLRRAQYSRGWIFRVCHDAELISLRRGYGVGCRR